eukprot:ANDGO_08464.mRNA.1 LOG family protein YvdD
MRVTVFGASAAKDGDSEYAVAAEVGRQLAEAGHTVLNGGYGGTMEASARGAVEAGGKSIGVICSPCFPNRPKGNVYLSSYIDTGSIPQRLDELTKDIDAYVVLPGKLGTLNELVLVWNNNSIAKLSNRTPVPIFVFRNPWEPIVDAVKHSLHLSDADGNLVSFVDSVDDFVTKLAQISNA